MAIFTATAITAFSFIKDTEGRPYTRLAELPRIPGIYYFLLLIGWLVIAAIVKIQKSKSGKIYSPSDSLKSLKSDNKIQVATVGRPSLRKEVLFTSLAALTYIVCVFLSWIFEYVDLKVNLIVLTMIYCTTYMLIAAIGGSFFLKAVIPLTRSRPKD